MAQERNSWYWAVMVVVGVVLGLLLWNKPQAPSRPVETAAPTGTTTQSSSQAPVPSSTPETPQGSGTKLQGRLYSSDNLDKGNLMLVISPEGGRTQAVYIKTQRDFNALVGKSVEVRFSGTTDKFTLEDIVELTSR